MNSTPPAVPRRHPRLPAPAASPRQEVAVNARLIVLRAGVWFLTFVEIVVGLFATLAPRAFYDYVPWVDLIPPFSEHLMRDYGAMNLSLALVFVVAVVTMERRTVRIALGAYLLFAIPHLIFHLTHLEHFTTGAGVWQTTLLTVAVLLPVGLLILTAWRPRPSTAT
jgi:hypothetical protein